MINHHRAVRSCHNIYRLGFLFTKFRGGGAASYIYFLNRCRQCKKYTFPLWYMIKESHMFNQGNFVCRGRSVDVQSFTKRMEPTFYQMASLNVLLMEVFKISGFPLVNICLIITVVKNFTFYVITQQIPSTLGNPIKILITDGTQIGNVFKDVPSLRVLLTFNLRQNLTFFGHVHCLS